MHIPVGYETSASTKDTRDYRCRTCGHRQQAEVTGIGTGMQTFLNSQGTAQRRARDSARHELRRTIRFAACPKCRRRSGYLKFMAPYLWVTGVFVALGVVFGYAPTWFAMNMRESDKAICATYVTWGFAIFAVLAGGLPLWFRWANNDARVKWLDV